MAYTKQTWQDYPNQTTPVNASRLNHIEDGIFNAAAEIDGKLSIDQGVAKAGKYPRVGQDGEIEFVNPGGTIISELDDIPDVDITTPTDGQVLTYDADSDEWVNANSSGGASTLGELSDVDMSGGLAGGMVLTYLSSTRKWTPQLEPPEISKLNDLEDVQTGTLALGNVLFCQGAGSPWIGRKLPIDNLDGVSIINPQSGMVLVYRDGSWQQDYASKYVNLSDLADVNTTDIDDGQTLVYDSTTQKWNPSDIAKEPIKLYETLYSGQTSVTFEDESITATAMIDIYTDKYGVNPTSIDDSVLGELTLNFESETDDIMVILVVKEVD